MKLVPTLLLMVVVMAKVAAVVDEVVRVALTGVVTMEVVQRA